MATISNIHTVYNMIQNDVVIYCLTVARKSSSTQIPFNSRNWLGLEYYKANNRITLNNPTLFNIFDIFQITLNTFPFNLTPKPSFVQQYHAILSMQHIDRNVMKQCTVVNIIRWWLFHMYSTFDRDLCHEQC